jgi:AraC-like DNA-binding protein
VIEGVTWPAPSATGFAARCALAALRKRGVDVEPLLNRAGLSEQHLDNPRVRVSAASQARFLEFSAEALRDAAFGLHLAEQANPREAGLLFYAVSAAKTVREALALLARYSGVVNESGRWRLTTQPGGMIVEMDFVGLPRHRARQNMEFAIAIIVKVIRELTGQKLRPSRIVFANIRAVDIAEFRRFFGCPVEFGGSCQQIAFSNEVLATRLVTEDPHLLEVLQPFCEEAAKTRATAIGSLRAAVENEIQLLLPHGQADAETVAKAIALNVRTLARRLRAEGATFAEVVDQLRHSLALQYLQEPGFNLMQIAWLLGYKGSSSFNHAFKRWTNRSPSQVRKEQQARVS